MMHCGLEEVTLINSISSEGLWGTFCQSKKNCLTTFLTLLIRLIFRHLQIFNQNEFFRGISLPVPPTLETLESKMPARILQNPYAIDFLKVTFSKF